MVYDNEYLLTPDFFLDKIIVMIYLFTELKYEMKYKSDFCIFMFWRGYLYRSIVIDTNCSERMPPPYKWFSLVTLPQGAVT